MQPDPRLTPRFESAARAAAYLTLCIAATGMTGWVLSVDLFKSVVPGVVTMKANTPSSWS